MSDDMDEEMTRLQAECSVLEEKLKHRISALESTLGDRPRETDSGIGTRRNTSLPLHLGQAETIAPAIALTDPVGSHTPRVRFSSELDLSDSGPDQRHDWSMPAAYSAPRTRITSTPVSKYDRTRYMDMLNMPIRRSGYPATATSTLTTANAVNTGTTTTSWSTDTNTEPGITFRKRTSAPAATTNDKIGKNYMKPATFDGSGSWIDYRTHFEACANINGWDIVQKGLYLAASLRGQAQTVLGNMTEGALSDFTELSESLEARFAPSNQTELYRAMLRERRHKANESLPELGESIRRLSHLAYPTAPREVTETIAKDQFVDALSDFDMRLRIQQSRPKSLNEAIRLAVEIEAFSRADRQRRAEGGYARTAATEDAPGTTAIPDEMSRFMKDVRTAIARLETKVQNLAKSKPQGANKSEPGSAQNMGSRPKCTFCGRLGHQNGDCRIRQRQQAKKTDKSKEKPNSGSNQVLQTRVDNGAGLFMPAKVNGVQCNLLIDTGATLSLVSESLFKDVTSSEMIEVQPVSQKVMGADCNPLIVTGQATFQIAIGSYTTGCRAAIANIGVDGILGLDFLKSHKCLVDVQNQQLLLSDRVVTLILRGSVNDHEATGIKTVQKVSVSDFMDKRDGSNLAALQDTDSDIGLVKRWVVGKQRPQYPDIKGKSKVITSLWAQCTV